MKTPLISHISAWFVLQLCNQAQEWRRVGRGSSATYSPESATHTFNICCIFPHIWYIRATCCVQDTLESKVSERYMHGRMEAPNEANAGYMPPRVMFALHWENWPVAAFLLTAWWICFCDRLHTRGQKMDYPGFEEQTKFQAYINTNKANKL